MAEPLKYLFSDSFVKRLGLELEKNDSGFKSGKFLKTVIKEDNWDQKELKDRMHRITHCMHDHLSGSYLDKLKTLHQVAPGFTGFPATVFPNFVEHYGLEYRKESTEALVWFTRFSTSEFAIRPFLKKYPDLIEEFYHWAEDPNYHVRRLASEGCRPLLPWAMKLEQFVKDPAPIIPILDKLKNDPEDYVYRSVANNLNDLSKHHPELVLKLAKSWHGKSATTDWVLKHALRTLLKKGNGEALSIFGFKASDVLKPLHFSTDKKQVQIGQSALLNINLKNAGKKGQFRIEYHVHYVKKSGQSNAKVFQITERNLEAGEKITFSKRLDFKDLTTRKHYPGTHKIVLNVNGKPIAETHILLK